jgi:putative ABC transport system permease protein
MYKNYFIISFRNLVRNKVFSIVNIFGLALGMAACFLIMMYVRFEMSYDRFHEKKDRIYRVVIDSDYSSQVLATNHPAAGPAMKDEFPEVEEFARIVHLSMFTFTAASIWSYIDEKGNEKVFNEEKVYEVDPAFLTMFSFPFIHGNPETAFSDVLSVVISKTISEKFFGNDNPIGKTLVMNGMLNFAVTGVFEDISENSHIKFNILTSFIMRQGMERGRKPGWEWQWPEFYTYVLLSPKTSPEILQAKLPEFVSDHLGWFMKEFNAQLRFILQPVTDIHLKSENLTINGHRWVKELEVHESEQTVYFLILIATIILLIAWINYINLSTSISIRRAHEVGLRKVAGASKRQLIIQFLSEAATVNLIAMLISFVLISLAFRYFNQITGKNIGHNLWTSGLFGEAWFWTMPIIVFLLGSFLAGLYPAFVLSSFKVASIIKGKFSGSRSGIATRKVLVGFQFHISVGLLAGTLIVYQQVSFMRNQELGYVKDQLLVIRTPSVGDSTTQRKAMVFISELRNNPDINNFTLSDEIPGKLIRTSNSLRNIDKSVEDQIGAFHFGIDTGFFDTYGIPLLAGRNFRPEERWVPQDMPANPVIVNEKLAESLGYKNPHEAVNQRIIFGQGERNNWIGEIIGVAGNFHQRSLREGYDAILFFPNNIQYITINLNMTNPSRTISFIENRYKTAFPGNPFDYFFLDDYFDKQYAADQRFGMVFGLFSGLALLIAAMGLFGLSTFMITQRTREIAIRKVLGATITSMIKLFSKEFVKLIIIANLITLPVIYYFAKQWLENFAFHTGVNWLIFVIPAAMLLVISLATVGSQTIKTASKNLIRPLSSE